MAKVIVDDLDGANAAADLIEGTLHDAVLKLASDYETVVGFGSYSDDSAPGPSSLLGLRADAQKIADVFSHLEAAPAPPAPTVEGT